MKKKIKNSKKVFSLQHKRIGKNASSLSRQINKRMIICSSILCLGFALIALRALQLQLSGDKKMAKLASRQYRRTITLTPERGTITDINNSPLAISLEVKSIYADPQRVKNKRQTAKKLAKVLKIDAKRILEKLKRKKSFVWIKRKVSNKQAEKIANLDLPGIDSLPESKRFYPNNQLAANLLGFTGLDANGLAGLELKYDHYLLNPLFKVHGERDAKGRLILTDPLSMHRHRQSQLSIKLTIDKTIQYIAEKELENAINKYQAKAGTVTIIEPKSGRILAMASHPTFNPNNVSSSQPWQRRNRPAEIAYEPGSTFKPLLVASSIEEGIVEPKEKFYCKGGDFSVSGKIIHDSSKKDWLDLYGILKYSSNIGAAKLGLLLGKRKYIDYIYALGFGNKTNLSLPGETRGLIRPIESWRAIDLATISFGQGIAVSPLQLIFAFSTLANQGKLMSPYLVDSIQDSSGKMIVKNKPVVLKKVFSEKVAASLTKMLLGVTEKGGTGSKAALENFSVAGKTGTSQKIDPKSGSYSEAHYVSSFVGFTPAESPRLEILTTIDEPAGKITSGGYIAAPVFRNIAKRVLTYLRVPGSINNQPSTTPAMAKQQKKESKHYLKFTNNGKLPNFKEHTLREVIKYCQQKGITLEAKGSGIAVWQQPLAGTALKKTKLAKVNFSLAKVL